MPIVGKVAQEKSGRARRGPARPKSGEETPKDAMTEGSHGSTQAAASRSGHSREIGALEPAQAIIKADRHELSLRCSFISRSASMPAMPRSAAA